MGWYILLPLLLYAPIGVWRAERDAERRVWLWLTSFAWMWILICAVRAGGDQWDNPRYRLIFFGVQALVASRAWLAWRADQDAWLPRIVAAELVCLLLFGQWYVARYYLIGIHLPILMVMGMCIGSVLLIFLGGAAWDRIHKSAAR
jgi:peptidoglycan/LPS O-acetylase OafA/YrhL